MGEKGIPACRECEFTGSFADQVFRCAKCDSYPEDCMEGSCGCRCSQEPEVKRNPAKEYLDRLRANNPSSRMLKHIEEVEDEIFGENRQDASG